MLKPLLLLLSAAACAAVAAGSLVDDSSFEAPFSEFDVDGTRLVPGYKAGGDAEIKKMFVRLTSDRQNREGYIWSRKVISSDEWTAVLKFRISGQGKHLFGDGMAFWFTTDPAHRGGKVQGHNEFFTGFGIVLDTFVNAENAAYHKDVSLVASDGQHSVLARTDFHRPGCDGSFRRHEGRDDFAPAETYSAIKVVFSGGRVSVFLDSKGSGDFQTCINGAELPEMPTDWWRHAHHGVTASTGDLADNHDVVGLTIWRGVVDTGDVFDQQTPVGLLPDSWGTGDERADNAIREAVSALETRFEDRLAKMEHHLEHQMSAVQDGLSHALDQLRDRETATERALSDLEARVKRSAAEEVGSGLANSVESRLAVLELKLKEAYEAHYDERVQGLQQQVQAIHSTARDALRAGTEAGGSGWVWAFLFVVLLVGGVAFHSWRTQQMLSKSHLP